MARPEKNTKRKGNDNTATGTTRIEISPEGNVVVYTNGTVTAKPATNDAASPANDTPATTMMAGTKMADGTIFAGLTANGQQQIYVMPTDLKVTMTFNVAAEAVKKLNIKKALGHDDWQIPSLENLRVLYKNQDEGALKGTFTKEAGKGSGYPDWYSSSTEGRGNSSLLKIVRFSDGNELWNRKDDDRLSCRPVRLVSAGVSSPSTPKPA